MKSRISLTLVVSLIALAIGAQQALAATTYVVGTCKPSFKSFAHIQDALNALPAPTTVQVCPGSYPEQVTINQPVILEGIKSGSGDRAVVAVPAGGFTTFVASVVLGVPFAPQILVTTGSVTITNLTVDGTGNNLAGTGIFLAGIFFESGSFGVVNQVATRFQIEDSAGYGIWAENGNATNDSITIENSSFHDADFAGIVAASNQTPPTLTVTITGNNVQSSINAIAIQDVSGTVSNNIAAGTNNAGIAMSGPASFTNNRVVGSPLGIDYFGGGAIISSNIAWFNTNDGIFFESGVVDGTIKSNKISMSPVGIEFNCGTPTVSGNTINDVGTGIDTVPPSYNSSNVFENVDTIRTDGCPPSAPAKRPLLMRKR